MAWPSSAPTASVWYERSSPPPARTWRRASERSAGRQAGLAGGQGLSGRLRFKSTDRRVVSHQASSRPPREPTRGLGREGDQPEKEEDTETMPKEEKRDMTVA